MTNNAVVAINLKLMKNIFDPNAPKVFGRNVYWLMFMKWTAFVLFLLIFGSLGYLVNANDAITNVDVLMAIAIHSEMYQMIWQACVFLYQADVVWEFFDVLKVNFLKSKRCTDKISMSQDEFAKILQINHLYYVMCIVIGVQWMLFPLAVNWSDTTENSSRHRYYENILNLRYPVDVSTYNQYYFVYFVLELVILSFSMFSLITFDIFTISICRVFTVHYQVLITAFECTGVEVSFHSETVRDICNEEYNHLISILSDQIRLHLMLKSYYSVAKSIVLIRIVFISSTIICLTYSFIVICSSDESLSILNFIKVGSSVILASIQLYIYCYLFNIINIARMSVNFGIYSCDWTMMNLKFKKIVLLAMQMNNATQLILRASPKKIIDLQLFTNVMNTSHNIVSVMSKTSM